MNVPIALRQPVTLDEGAFYERWEWNAQKGGWNMTLVQLLAYANCPAMVWIRDDHDKINECPRSELYGRSEEAM